MTDPDDRADPPQGAETDTEATVEPRPRLTGEELQSRFDGWASARRQQRAHRSAETVSRSRRRTASTVLGLILLAVLVTSGLSSNDYESSRSDNNATITRLQHQLAAASAPATSASPRPGTSLPDLIHTVARKATTVAAQQQGFAGLYRQASTEPTQDNGTPNQAMLAIARHRRTLAPYFDPHSYLVSERQAYTYSSLNPFDAAEQMDPRFAWYVRYSGATAKPAEDAEWKLEAVTPDLNSDDPTAATDRAQVIWMCRDTGNSSVLAWATADYTAGSGHDVFDNLQVVVTAAGAKDTQTTGQKDDRSPAIPPLGDLSTSAAPRRSR